MINRGINGGGVLQIGDGAADSTYPGDSAQKPFAEMIASDKADLAMVFIGITDVWRCQTAPDDFENALRGMVDSAKANQTRLVLVTLTVRGELPDGKNSDDAKIDQHAELTRKVARDTGTTLDDLRAASVAFLQNNNAQFRVDGTLHFKPSGVLTYDGVHVTAKDNELLAHLISDGIVRAQAVEKPTAEKGH